MSEAENEHESLVDRAQLVRLEPPGCTAQSLRVDDRRLLNEDACFSALETDRRAEARRVGARRSWSDEHSAEAEELVSLNDDRVTCTALLVPAHAAVSGETEDLAPDHSADGLGRELGHLLSDDAHLLAVNLIGRESADLFANHRASPPARSSLAQRRPYRLRVGQSIGADNLERRRGRIVEPNMDRTRHRMNVAQFVLRAHAWPPRAETTSTLRRK